MSLVQSFAQLITFFTEDGNKCAKKCMDYEVEGVNTRGKSKRTWNVVNGARCKKSLCPF